MIGNLKRRADCGHTIPIHMAIADDVYGDTLCFACFHRRASALKSANPRGYIKWCLHNDVGAREIGLYTPVYIHEMPDIRRKYAYGLNAIHRSNDVRPSKPIDFDILTSLEQDNSCHNIGLRRSGSRDILPITYKMHEGHKLLHDSTYESAIAPLLLDWMEENPSPLFGPTFYRAAAQHIGKCIEDAINHGTTHVSCRLVPDESVLKTAAPPSPADMAQIVQYAMKSAAVVEGSRGNVKWAGTCFRVTERHFVTCAHVVNIENRPPFDMTTVLNIKDNNEVIIKAWPVLINYDIDAAVIEIDTSKLTNFGPPLKMGNSKEIYPGQKIITVGAPEGVEGVASIGYVASEYYKIPDLDSDIFFINLEIHPGSSGGPILDENGLVIGIARGAYGRGEAHDMGLNYCIPINYIKEWLDKRLFRVR